MQVQYLGKNESNDESSGTKSRLTIGREHNSKRGDMRKNYLNIFFLASSLISLPHAFVLFSFLFFREMCVLAFCFSCSRIH